MRRRSEVKCNLHGSVQYTKGGNKGGGIDERDSPQVDTGTPEGMYGRVELTADKDVCVAHVLFIRGAMCPEVEHVLKLLRETEQARDRALDLGLGARLGVKVGSGWGGWEG